MVFVVVDDDHDLVVVGGGCGDSGDNGGVLFII